MNLYLYKTYNLDFQGNSDVPSLSVAFKIVSLHLSPSQLRLFKVDEKFQGTKKRLLLAGAFTHL